jgi:acetyl-CoA acetyltransferase
MRRSSLAKTAIAGIGFTDYTRNSGRSVEALADEAARKAIADAGLKPTDIDGVITYGLGDTVGTSVVATNLGLRRLRHYADYGAGGNVACAVVNHAAMAVATGQADAVLVYRALNGASGQRYGGKAFSRLLEMGGVHSDAEQQFLDPYGVLMPAHHFALLCRRHMTLYGTTEAQLGAIAVTCRAHASLNENAQKRTPMTLDDYFASPWIAEPFRVLDCCLQTDGACALVVTTLERARDLRQPPVRILAGATGAGPGNRGGMWSNFTPEPADTYARYLREDLFGAAGVGPQDIDFAQLYDCFTYSVLAQVEDYGFCAKGEGGPFLAEGAGRLGGRLPINTNGGLLSEGYIHGLNGVVEGVVQLRRQAGPRQVADAEVGLVTAGGATATGSALVLGRA